MPQVLPIDLTAVVAVIMGCLIVLIPVAGLTARFALKPVVEALGRSRQVQADRDQLELVERRLELLEQQVAHVDAEVDRLSEAQDFHTRLESGS